MGRLGTRNRTGGDTLRISRATVPEREVVDERYEITALIGRGGMAEVFAARDRRLGRVVAIKRARRDVSGDAAIRDRLLREAAALASIESPHVVAIHDVGISADDVYLVMQRLQGRTLEDELEARTGASIGAPLERGGPIAPARACRIARDLLAGLAAVHAAGLIHRDLKPSNVLIDRSDRAVLIDLGAALHPRKRPLTAPGSVLGTADCLAPEQVALDALDGRVDLFQLGLLLILLVTGKLAPRGVDPRTLPLPPALHDVICGALAPVATRFASTAEMQRALDGALAACTLQPLEPIELAVPTRPTLRWPEPIPTP